MAASDYTILGTMYARAMHGACQEFLIFERY